jgi:4-hydroxybenzoate polyprenyltransferase
MSSKTANRTVTPGFLPQLYWLLGPILRIGRKAKNVVVYTQLDIAAMAIAGVLTVTFVLSLPLNPAPLVIGLVTYAVYVGDRIGDIKREPSATSDRVAFMQRHRRLLSITSAAAYGLAITISVWGGPLALGITLVPGVFWILYATEWVDIPVGSLKRLKSLLIVNSSVVAGAWAVSLVFLPLAFADASVTPLVLALLVYFFLDVFVNAEVPNVRDIEDDAANGVSTIPNVFGVRRTRHITYLINGFLIAFLLSLFLVGSLALAIAVAFVAGRIYALLAHSFIGRIEDYRRLEIVGEMKHVFVGVLLLATILY